MWKTTSFTKKVGIQLPIIQAPMAGDASTPELIAAVSNAGGLGSLGAGYMPPAKIRAAIKRIRTLTDKPFAINLFIPEKYQTTPEQMQKACYGINQCCNELNIEIKPIAEPYAQSFEEQINVIIEEKVPLLSYTFGTLDSMLIKQLQKNNTILIGTATTLAEAHILEESGIDIIVGQSSEAGGHRGTFIGNAEDALIDLVSLISQLVKQIKIPIIAAGGIMNGRDILASLELGASGVQMGTAFLSCHESGIPAKYKQILLAQEQDNTVLTRAFSGKLARGIRNKFIDCLEAKKASILDYPVQNALTSFMRTKAKEQNNMNFISMWAGQSAQLCRDVSAGELLNTLIVEMETLLNEK